MPAPAPSWFEAPWLRPALILALASAALTAILVVVARGGYTGEFIYMIF